MKKRVADIIMDTLVENGIDTCFCVVGGGAMHLNNALLVNDKIEKVFNHHEQACAMAAEGYARMSGKMAAVMVTAGPGSMNALNGVQGAWADSVPMIVISGFPRWSTSALSTGLDIRVAGIQEHDIVTTVSNMTKYAINLLEPKDVKMEVQKAIDIALDGRRGPVWINVPLDIQPLHIEESELTPVIDYKSDRKEDFTEEIGTLNKWIEDSKCPCILTGSAIRTGNAEDEFLKFIKKTGIPVVGGFQQSDILDANYENYFGMSGVASGRAGNFILQNADLVIVLGNSLSHNQIGYSKEEFAKKAKLVMVDAQKDEARKPGLNVDLLIHAEIKDFFTYTDRINAWKKNENWIRYCKDVYARFPQSELFDEVREKLKPDAPVPYKLFWEKVFERTDENAVFALGNSSSVCGGLEEPVHKMGQRVLVNYNCGSMGYDIPNSIGAYMAAKRPVICITGDGAVMMNLQELQTIRHNAFPIKVVIFSNGGYCAIRNTCNRYFNGQHIGCDEETGISFPDFALIAEGFGLKYKKCSNVGELDDAIDWLVDTNEGLILEITEEEDETGVPYVASKMDEEGRFVMPSIEVMSPLLDDAEFDKWHYKG